MELHPFRYFTGERLRLLRILLEAKEALTVKQLITRVPAHRSTVRANLKLLEDFGWLTGTPERKQGTSRSYTLTDKGRSGAQQTLEHWPSS